MFGRQGLVTRGVFGLFPGLDIGLYGPVGVILVNASGNIFRYYRSSSSASWVRL